MLLLAVVTATACTTGSAPPTKTGTTTVADPNTVLNQLATDLRSRIDALTAGLKTTSANADRDDSRPCGTPTHEPWPQQWGYGRHLVLTVSDSRPTVRQLADTLHAQGWTLRTDHDDATDLQITAQLQGTVIYLAGGNTQGTMVVNGASACVNADGTIDHRPVN